MGGYWRVVGSVIGVKLVSLMVVSSWGKMVRIIGLLLGVDVELLLCISRILFGLR